MSITPPSVTAPPKIQRVSLTGWLGGYNSTNDDDRIPQNSLKTASNVVIDQNGTIRPRPGMVLYGTQPPGTILGEIKPFIKMNGTTPEKWQAAMINVTGTTHVWVNKDGGTWQECTGKDFNGTAPSHFEQIAAKLLITNGVDNLSYLNIATLTVVPFIALTTPTVPSLTAGSNLTTPVNFTYRYRITATNQGETAASVAGTVGVKKIRDQWAGTTANEFVTLTWNRVTGAQRYNIYVGDQAGFEYYLDTVSDPTSGTTVTYTDDGSQATNTNRLAPSGDSTAGPKTTRTRNVAGQIFMVGDTENPYRLWFGGSGDASLDFSAYNGGGWVEMDKGGENFPNRVEGFRDGQGNPAASVFSKGIAGHGKLTHASPTTTTIGDTVITYMTLKESNGESGTDSPDGVVYARDNLWYPSRDGFKRTGTKAQIQNILSTEDVSEGIQRDIQALNTKSMEKCVGVSYQNRIYWALPVGSENNNQIWVLDLQRKAIWTLPWYINADWLWLYDDNNGITHFMVLCNNKIYEFNYSSMLKDDGLAFNVDMSSGLIKFSEDGMEWASVLDVTFIFLRPQGVINMNVSGKTEDQDIAPLGSKTYVSDSQTTFIGWSENKWSVGKWGQVDSIPNYYTQSRISKRIEIDEDLNFVQWQVTASTVNTDFQLSEVILQYVPIGVIEEDDD